MNIKINLLKVVSNFRSYLVRKPVWLVPSKSHQDLRVYSMITYMLVFTLSSVSTFPNVTVALCLMYGENLVKQLKHFSNAKTAQSSGTVQTTNKEQSPFFHSAPP